MSKHIFYLFIYLFKVCGILNENGDFCTTLETFSMADLATLLAVDSLSCNLAAPGSIPGGVRDFNLFLGTEHVSFVFCPLLPGRGPEILLITD